MIDYSVLERMVKPDVATLGYFGYRGSFKQLALIAGQPHVAETQKLPLSLSALNPTEFKATARELLERALIHPDENIIVNIGLFPEELQDLARRVEATLARLGP